MADLASLLSYLAHLGSRCSTFQSLFLLFYGTQQRQRHISVIPEGQTHPNDLKMNVELASTKHRDTTTQIRDKPDKKASWIAGMVSFFRYPAMNEGFPGDFSVLARCKKESEQEQENDCEELNSQQGGGSFVTCVQCLIFFQNDFARNNEHR